MALIPGIDLGVPWPPITDPDIVAGARTIGAPQIDLPASTEGSPPLLSAAALPLNVEDLPTTPEVLMPLDNTVTLVVDPALTRPTTA